MSKTTVKILQDGENRSAEPYEVSIVEGSTIEFSAPAGADTLLSLAPETAVLLDPKPDTLQVKIAGGASVSYKFRKAAANRSYCCQVLAAGSDPGPIQCPDAQGDAVLTILSSGNRGVGAKTGRGL
jgi:hypothetical protein